MLMPMRDLLQNAKQGHYGVAAPNVWNRETIEAAFMAADELHAPIILDVGGVHGVYECYDIARFYELRYPQVPFALNLDHGGPYEVVISAIRAGFSSVMIDRSEASFEDNVRETAEIVKIAHACGVSVEAELGHVGQGTEYATTREAGLTHLDEAQEYVERTGIDCLAVSIGTSHGVYKGKPKLEFPLLDTLAEQIDLPLVLHGGSSTGDDNLHNAVVHGIQKVNLNTDLVIAGQEAMKKAYDNDLQIEVPAGNGEFFTKRMNMQQLIAIGADGWKAKLVHYMKLFMSNNQW
ncbi:ketose-bisphosphate aldolase [Lacticaseibacillus baoqingensis]|uniref:Ketose-bisphosphate aldolase n=1 Tax=Lacticaseibacillus baoqingensis TaxID=2486013 RepID=A0ABW4E9T7_9LACO